MSPKLTISIFAVIALSVLAVNPSPIARAIDRVLEPSLDLEAFYATSLQGMEEGDLYWTLQLGMNHRLKMWLPADVQPDSAYSLALIERAMDGGLAMAGYWYYTTLRTQDALVRAARSGDSESIRILAYLEARSYCEMGVLPQGTMASFLAPYANVMNADSQARFLPEAIRSGARATMARAYAQTRTGILHGIPEHFSEICTDPSGFDRLLPLD